MPAVSVIIPLHNKGPYVSATLAAVQAQSVRDWELIVVDDRSTDDGPLEVRKFAAADARIRLAIPSKRGPGAARNFGLDHATGEWILFLDADDLIEADYLERQLGGARRDSGVDIIAGCWQNMEDTLSGTRELKRPCGFPDRPDLLRDSAIAFTAWAVHAAIVRRAAITREFRWPEEMDGLLAEDTPFWFRLVSERSFNYSDCKGAIYRVLVPGCRTDFTPDRWFKGLDRSVETSLDFLNRRGRQPTVGQCENLMRLYSDLYVRASRSGSMETAQEAIAKAEHWLDSYLRQGGRLRLSLLARHALGLRRFLRLTADWAAT